MGLDGRNVRKLAPLQSGVLMEILVRISDEKAEEDLRSFYHWLLEENEIRRTSRISLIGAQPQDSEMGATLEIIKLVVESGFELGNLALAYAVWRENRPNQAAITIECDGVKVTLTEADKDSADKILRALRKD